MKIKLTFLGTSQAIPTAKRNHTAILLSYADENILVDCGEGTQRQFRKARLNPCKLTRLLITHWHGDHVLGIPGLLQSLAMNGYNKTLHVYGPKGTKRYMGLMFRLFVFTGKIKYEIQEVNGRFLETKDFYIEAREMEHGVCCNAYTFVEKDKRRVDKEKLKKIKIPSSPLIRKLQEGKNINWQGRIVKAREMTYIEKGKKISFIFDTVLNENAVRIAKDSDLLICEATYSSSEEEKAEKYKHLTARQAAEIAKKAGVKRLILSHISQRYEKNQRVLLREARNVFRNTEVAKDMMKIEI